MKEKNVLMGDDQIIAEREIALERLFVNIKC